MIIPYQIDVDIIFARTVQQTVQPPGITQIVSAETMVPGTGTAPFQRIGPGGHPDFRSIQPGLGKSIKIHFIIICSPVRQMAELEAVFTAQVDIGMNVDGYRIEKFAVGMFKISGIFAGDPDEPLVVRGLNFDLFPWGSDLETVTGRVIFYKQPDFVQSCFVRGKAECPERHSFGKGCFPDIGLQ